MAKERLSKLQKWVLIEAYKNNNFPDRRDIYEKFWGKNQVWNRYCPYMDMRGNQLGSYKFNNIINKYIVTTSRSLKNLEKKGLIRASYPLGSFELTKTGREKAKSLMLISMDINNKNKEEA